MNDKVEQFIKANRKTCWESDYENGEYCIGENKVRQFLESIPMQAVVMPMDDTIKILYEKLRAQISIYAGKKDGGLATLQDLYSAINDGETIICECCGQRITGKGGHLTGCDIVKRYFKAFGHWA